MLKLYENCLDLVDHDDEQSFGLVTIEFRLCPRKDMGIDGDGDNGISAIGLVDSGADYSLLSRNKFDNFVTHCRNSNIEPPARAGGYVGSEKKFFGISVVIPHETGNLRLESPPGIALADEDIENTLLGCHVLLGRDFLSQLRAVVAGERSRRGGPNGYVQIWH